MTGDDVLTVDEVPHHWLFPRMAAVVHHAGAGTTAAGLRAGVPAVPVPAQMDAPFWAARLTRLGVSPGPVPLRDLSADRLTAALRQATDTTAFRGRAQALATRIAGEDGAGAVVAAVGRLSGG
ncbi:nucleotide disphospho-sugar-binding domain-containing protein [Streptomyces sp. So13.3]|uniref:glycosyltransferase n=1 Tax=Streptomyces sp. So13.3 TaxID=2136173 RepID=UPI00269661C8